ncbi:hypothetical protein COB64_00665 [Candidatus Wolfebacteria bacterium]|nr:MAG: hypothetical protein COB64_00665 [Candidatus Wolfebacteria bacterium]
MTLKISPTLKKAIDEIQKQMGSKDVIEIPDGSGMRLVKYDSVEAEKREGGRLMFTYETAGEKYWVARS